ncbi:MAG: N-acetyltransferase, partial [Lentisphaeraceae bacterium]|nr:N-acetyltransferase [Lentisphaeraceae bacterium]
MHISILKSITEIPAEDWDKLNGTQNPFLSYSFFYSLEESNSLGSRTGWFPHFIVIEDNSEIIAGACLYLKNNSYGEYIFDWAWADAYARSDQQYYPKLISALPFTPITTPKLLVSPKADSSVKDFLLSEIIKISQSYSSFHSLFIPVDECPLYQNQGLQIRHTLQYHWENKGYTDFNEFLAVLKQKKRKHIRRERKAIQQENIEFKNYSGKELRAEHAELMYGFYLTTVDKKNAYDYLSAEFFQMIVEMMPESIVFFTAEKENNI